MGSRCKRSITHPTNLWRFQLRMTSRLTPQNVLMNYSSALLAGLLRRKPKLVEQAEPTF